MTEGMDKAFVAACMAEVHAYAEFREKVKPFRIYDGLIYLEKPALELLAEVKLYNEAIYLFSSLADSNDARSQVLESIFSFIKTREQISQVFVYLKPGSRLWHNYVAFLEQSDIPNAPEIAADLKRYDELHRKTIPRLELLEVTESAWSTLRRKSAKSPRIFGGIVLSACARVGFLWREKLSQTWFFQKKHIIPAYFFSIPMSTFLLAALSFISLLLISTGVYLASKRFNFPYTVSLVAVGIVIALLSQFPIFAFLDDFHLTPEILLYVFLPILLFESAYNMKYKEVLRSARSISLLAVVSLIVSAFLIAAFIHFGALLFGLHIPFLVALLFGTLISATDPVAVLALFKELGAPRRLTLIFEGESLFNDGTAFALFLVILAYIQSVAGFHGEGHGNLYSVFASHLFGTDTTGLIVTGIISFVLMILVGMLFGSFIGVVFSKMIEKIKNNEFLEVMLTLILAHTTFILSEVLNHFFLPVSGVIATTLAALVVGNYGRYKISPKVEETMERFWGFFAFISNSLVFILVGIMIVSLGVDWKVMIVPVAIAIIAVIIARAISVYGIIIPLNWTKKEEHIPLSWQHMLSWGSLRGALAIIMVLLIPESLTISGWDFPFSIRDFALALTVGCIAFTTFIKATTIIPLMKHFGIDKLHEIEEVEHVEGKMIMLLEVLAKIGSLKERGFIVDEEYALLLEKYTQELQVVRSELDALMKQKGDAISGLIKRVITLHALGIEKFSLKRLYMYNEITEREFKVLLRKNEAQIHRVEMGLSQIKTEGEKRSVNVFERLTEAVSAWLHRDVNPTLSRFMRARARLVTTDTAIKWLIVFEGIDFIAGRKEFKEIKELYSSFYDSAKEEHTKLFAANKSLLIEFDSHLANKSLLKQQEIIVEDLFQKEIISPKLYIRFKEEIEEKIYE